MGAAGLASRGTPSSSRAQGPTNPLALRRTFGQAGEPEVKLYRRALHALAPASWLPPGCRVHLVHKWISAAFMLQAVCGARQRTGSGLSEARVSSARGA